MTCILYIFSFIRNKMILQITKYLLIVARILPWLGETSFRRTPFSSFYGFSRKVVSPNLGHNFSKIIILTCVLYDHFLLAIFLQVMVTYLSLTKSCRVALVLNAAFLIRDRINWAPLSQLTPWGAVACLGRQVANLWVIMATAAATCVP